MAGTSRSDDDPPAPQGGGAAERLREFRAARGEPLEDDAAGDANATAGTTTTDETTAPPEDAEPSEGEDRTGDHGADGP